MEWCESGTWLAVKDREYHADALVLVGGAPVMKIARYRSTSVFSAASMACSKNIVSV